MKSLGICMGASSLSLILLEREGDRIRVAERFTQVHEGDPAGLLSEVLERHAGDCARIALTGRKYRDRVRMPSIPESQAVELAYGWMKEAHPEIEAIVSAGGETFMVYELDRAGSLANVHTGNKCAAGTGDFFLQQIKRMDLGLGEAMDQGDLAHPYQIASRCSVFSKSDCTHALNKGESKGRVVGGLCAMMAGKIQALLKKTCARRILLVGGLARNRLLVELLQRSHPDLVVAEEAVAFEALGAALWAMDKPEVDLSGDWMQEHGSSFSFLEPLPMHEGKVVWKQIATGCAQAGDRCIVGLDVGSTTTKAIVLRESDQAILASVYLRTNGDPVGASRRCYRELAERLAAPVVVRGLGVTGSGRQIAGVHALTDGVVNEIIAHARAAVHFDPEVDTLFEIGGQDAKYTHLTSRVASDYAMNEACSAGTGSFLEESARESMDIATEDIAEIAMRGTRPPNFNDQCAAFIASDIKVSIQEGLSREDIAAGLVYSICRNYLNRVKGQRPVGRKVFMQGGVCYNRAVPIAMASLTGREIIVPPEPGLMGAFGVALEVQHKVDLGLMEEGAFDLQELAGREVAYGKSFTCAGQRDRCDLKCVITQVEVGGRRFPFGGSCNRYVNLRRRVEVDADALDLVAMRERTIFETGSMLRHPNGGGRRIGINRSLMVHTLFPLYYTFFSSLGMEVVIPKERDKESMDRGGASFCYPVELAHGCFGELLKSDLDYVFLPQVRGMHVENGAPASVVCPLAQGEPYYLKAAFPELKDIPVLSPVLDFSQGLASARKKFLELGKDLGCDTKRSLRAFHRAVATQRAAARRLARMGREALAELEKDPGATGIVVFGRPYNAFTSQANLGIPRKFASRGHVVVSLDMLAFQEEEAEATMYWSMGQMIVKAAKLVQRHPQLFAAYITNFSCGPDSFLLNSFREIMGSKPSLTLELDGHTADAGVDTRVEAFLDIVASYRELQRRGEGLQAAPEAYRPAELCMDPEGVYVIDSAGRRRSLRDPKVRVVLPCMGERAAAYFAAVWRRHGADAIALPPPGEAALKTGRGNSSCKECLPFALVMGSVLEYLETRTDPDEVTVVFMPDSAGPCRFGQYVVEMNKRFRQKRIPNLATLSLSSENGYAGLSRAFQLRSWQAIILADVMDDIHSAVLALAEDRDSALAVFRRVSRRFERAMEFTSWENMRAVFQQGGDLLARIPRKGSLEDAKRVALSGEIFVRRDSLSRQFIVERLADQGIVCTVAPVHEWMYYTEYLYRHAIYLEKPTLTDHIGSYARELLQNQLERTIKHSLARSGFYEPARIQIGKLLESVRHLISPEMVGGDAALTVAASLNEIVDHVHGVIIIGPFGCLPNRIAEAILSRSLSEEKPRITAHPDRVRRVLEAHPALPFLAIESDGGAFTQLTQAKFEAFCLQVERLHAGMKRIEAEVAEGVAV